MQNALSYKRPPYLKTNQSQTKAGTLRDSNPRYHPCEPRIYHNFDIVRETALNLSAKGAHKNQSLLAVTPLFLTGLACRCHRFAFLFYVFTKTKCHTNAVALGPFYIVPGY